LRFAHFSVRYTSTVRLVRGYVLWWVGLFWWWFALQGEWNRIEWVAAACMATVGAGLGALVVSRDLLHFRVPLAAIRSAARVPLQVVIDFGIITVVLVRRLRGEDVRGRFVARSFESRGRGAVRRGDVAWRTITAMYSPNALVVDADPEERIALFHDLVPNRASEEPA
jgi:hypothetical protein